MYPPRRAQPKQTSITPTHRARQGPKIFPARKSPAQLFNQPRNEAALGKISNFVREYNILKQIHNINYSLCGVGMHLPEKKQQYCIDDVPFIESEHASFELRGEDGLVQEESRVREVLSGEGGIDEGDAERDARSEQIINQKLTISIKVEDSIEQSRNGKAQEEEQNFTDDEQSQTIKQKQTKITSKQESQPSRYLDEDFSGEQQTQQHQEKADENLRQTACFSFSVAQNSLKPKPTSIETSTNSRGNQAFSHRENQENINNLNQQSRFKKVNLLLNMQNDKAARRRRAQQIIEQDRKYLSRLMERTQH